MQYLSEMISTQAVLDSEIFTRDVLRQLRRGPDRTLDLDALDKRNLREADPQEKGRIIFHMDSHFHEFARALSRYLQQMQNCTFSVTHGSMFYASPDRSEVSEIPFSCWAPMSVLARQVEDVASAELLALQRLLCPMGFEESPMRKLQPLVFCLAWYLAWRDQQVTGLKMENILEILTVPFLGALKNSYITYERMAQEENRAIAANATDFKVTMPLD